MYARVEAAYELFDHTADMGLRIRADSLEGLLAPAAAALYQAIGSLIPRDDASLRRLELRDDDPAYLLRDFLAELLVIFERESSMMTHLESTEFRPGILAGDLRLARIDMDQSQFHREVKAITYHELGIRPVPGGLEATLIVDI